MGIHLPLKQALQCVPLRVWLALSVTTLGVSACVAPSGAAPANPARHGPVAVAARSMSLKLTATMHLVGRPGHVLSEKGSISGTLSGSVSSQSVTLPGNKGTSTFTFYTKGGSFSGKASTHGHVVGASAYFEGIATITAGTGVYAHAKGSNLQYTGVMNRQNFRVTDHVSGTIRY